jgi:two-component system, cell cycle response regulator
MHSLSSVLHRQRADDFAPMPCNGQTVGRLARYFEDVVVENGLQALVIAGRCLDGEPTRESKRLAKICATARHVYLFSCDSTCPDRTRNLEKITNLTSLEEPNFHSIEPGPFVLVMDARFSGLLASYPIPHAPEHAGKGYEMIWTFDPNVVFTAVEYLMARIGVQQPDERGRLESLLNTCATRASSTRMALSFTTKLAMLLQRQNDLETAISSIGSAISSTFELDTILQSAVEEVGRALRVRQATLVLWDEQTKKPEKVNVYERSDSARSSPTSGSVSSNGHHPDSRGTDSTHSVTGNPGGSVRAGNHDVDHQTRCSGNPDPNLSDSTELAIPRPLEIPITYRNTVTGLLSVEDDTAGRQWESEEILMIRTASDQLAVAISNARLFSTIQTQAVTDALTTLYNRRYFRERLNREINLADRNRNEVSLILLDLDRLKRVNDTFGHPAGDSCLVHVAATMKTSVRNTDICARYGGEEFVVILPQCKRDDALIVAEHLREAISQTPVPKVGQVTASIGVASYPAMASTADELVEMADRAMYLAKSSGRNQVRTLLAVEGSGC